MTKSKNKNKNKNKKKSNGMVASSRPVPSISGQGAYFSDMLKNVARGVGKSIPKGTFSKVGEQAGSMFGPLGGKLGSMLGQGISSITGYGDYTISQNSIMSRVDEGVQIPQFEGSEHATIFRHREFVQDISASGGAGFTNLSFPLNPGLNGTMPFLAQIAGCFDSYQILGMVIQFKSTYSDYSASGALGSVILATNYDPADAPYTSKIQMENS